MARATHESMLRCCHVRRSVEASFKTPLVPLAPTPKMSQLTFGKSAAPSPSTPTPQAGTADSPVGLDDEALSDADESSSSEDEEAAVQPSPPPPRPSPSTPSPFAFVHALRLEALRVKAQCVDACCSGQLQYLPISPPPSPAPNEDTSASDGASITMARVYLCPSQPRISQGRERAMTGHACTLLDDAMRP